MSINDWPVWRNAIRSLVGYYYKEWNINAIKTGDRPSLGQKELIFVEAFMLHWSGSIFRYLTEDNVLFSNDAFFEEKSH
jgi:flavorubredoxin